MKNTKRRLTSWILTLVMLLTLVPVMGGSANAAEYSTGAGSVSVDAYGNVTVVFTVTEVPGQQNLYGFGLCLFTYDALVTANKGSFPDAGTKLKNSNNTNFGHCSHVYTQMFADGYYVNNFKGNQEYTLTFPAESMEKTVSTGDVNSFLKDKTDGMSLADALVENEDWYVVVGPITTWNGSPSTNCDIYLGPSSDVLARPPVTVTYDANGGSGTMDPQTYVAGTNIDIPENRFTPPEGKVFAGFKSESGGTIYANVNDNIDGATTNFRIFDDLTLYAQWREPGGEMNPQFASAEFVFSYEETIGAIVPGNALPDLSVLTTDSIVVKDTEGNPLPVTGIRYYWGYKDPTSDEDWLWAEDLSDVAVAGVEYGLRVEVGNDGTYEFAWDDHNGVVTCSDSKLVVDTARPVSGYPSYFGAIIAAAKEGGNDNQVTNINVILGENDLPQYTVGDTLSLDGIELTVSTTPVTNGDFAALGFPGVILTEGNYMQAFHPDYLEVLVGELGHEPSYSEICEILDSAAEANQLEGMEPAWVAISLRFLNPDYKLQEDDTLGMVIKVGLQRGSECEIAQNVTVTLNSEAVSDLVTSPAGNIFAFTHVLGAPQPDEGGDEPADLGTIVDLTESIVTVDGNTVTVNKPEGDDEYIYFLTVLPEIYLEGTGMTAEQYVERHMLGVDKSIIDATTLDLTDVPGIHELANTTQIFVTNIETYESLDGYISGDSVVVVLKLHPDNVKVATYDSAADNPYFGSVGFTTAYAYGIYGVYATRVSAGAGAEVASAELTFTYEETIGAIVAGEELPDLSVIAPEHVVVKDTDGNVLTVVDVYADWLCKAPDLDEGWGWPDSNIAQDGMEYGIRIEVIGDGSYSFGTSWDDLTVLTCQDEKLSVNSAWVGDPNSAFVAFIEMSTVQQPEPPHEHEYTYTSNNNGTHNGTCECGEDAIENEPCTYVDGKCEKCGYDEPEIPDTYGVTVTVEMETETGDYTACDNAVVKLVSLDGEEQVKEQSTGNGVYTFENVVPGTYNVVITVGDKIRTVLVTVEDKDVDLGEILLPLMTINSKVDVSVDVAEDSPVKGALVGGLDALAEEIAGDVTVEDGVSVSVEVAMNIEAKMSDTVDPEHKKDIEEIAETQSENLTFLDIKINKTITTKQTGMPDSVQTDSINDTEILLEIVIPFDTANRSDFAVYRYHELNGSEVQKLTTTPNSDGEYIVVEDGMIKMYVRYFSTYAIGYSNAGTPAPSVTYTVSFNANGGIGTMADVTVAENAEYTLPVCYFIAPVGKEFKAWEINGTEYAAGTKITVTANVAVKAVWKDRSDSSETLKPSVSYYGVVVEKVKGGTVYVSSEFAAPDSIVTLTVIPNNGYELVSLTVENVAGTAINWTAVGGNMYTFRMPSGAAIVNAVFRAIRQDCSKNAACPIWSFKDAKPTAWYHDGVHYCIEKGLMNGLSGDQFSPNGTTTRAQIVTILWRLEGKPVVNYAMSYSDVAAGKWYTDAIRWATAAGIVNGYSDTIFAPNGAITREEMAVILWRYCQYKGIDVSVGEETNILSYSDAFDIHSWAIPAMQWACGAGVIDGMADGNSMKLDPTGNATRAQVATMLWRFCVETLMI